MGGRVHLKLHLNLLEVPEEVTLKLSWRKTKGGPRTEEQTQPAHAGEGLSCPASGRIQTRHADRQHLRAGWRASTGSAIKTENRIGNLNGNAEEFLCVHVTTRLRQSACCTKRNGGAMYRAPVPGKSNRG